MSEEKKDFVIKDRRTFAGDGKDVGEKEEQKEPSPEETKEQVPKDERLEKAPEDTAPDKEPEDTAPDKEPEAETQLPEINFVTFIMSLNASALVNLGMVEDPATGKKVKNLPIAKQTIDILGMLAEKTRGNLTSDEENLLKNILYEIRIIYVKEKG
jgi:hypothetical protein